jgi:hypothetical protein
MRRKRTIRNVTRVNTGANTGSGNCPCRRSGREFPALRRPVAGRERSDLVLARHRAPVARVGCSNRKVAKDEVLVAQLQGASFRVAGEEFGGASGILWLKPYSPSRGSATCPLISTTPKRARLWSTGLRTRSLRLKEPPAQAPPQTVGCGGALAGLRTTVAR